ncbi:thioredoxin [Dactylosporangium sp. NPDC000521]|uniref:thioredoxin n=1 Tax=Dactylosporangium sp. NPDC000521 TaxID=3363975 RepID=UPI0036AAA83F
MAGNIVACTACGKRNRVPAAASGRPACGSCGAKLPWIVDAGDDTFAEVAERSSTPVLVDLWATWCGPCRAVSPALEQVATELAGTVKLVKVDIDKAPGLSRRFDVRAVPTLMIVKDGKVVARQSGAANATVLRRWVEQSLASTA